MSLFGNKEKNGMETASGAGAAQQMAQGQTDLNRTEGAGTGRPGWKWHLVYFAVYTAVFCVAAAAVFIWFWWTKRRFVWKTDGVNQHYYGLLYFSRWGKEVIRQFRETHVLRLPTFSLRMGYGTDLYTTLAYYVIGDPFSLPAVFVPEKNMLAFHDVMLLVRFWLAGISFSVYNFFMGKRSRIGVLTGALIYVFNGFTLSGMRHHYFLNPFIFFPLLLIGCERFFRKKKPGMFIFMVFVTAVSNFYFFYMMMLMVVLYAVWRSLRLRGLRQFGRVLLDGLSFLWYGLLGVLLAAFLFLPVVLRFLQDPRAAGDRTISLLWPLKYYQNFLDSFLTNSSSALAESWTYMGFGAVAVFCVLFLFVQRKKHFDLKAAFVGLTALLLTPAAGYVLNGFSYPANRWMFAYALLIGTMTATAVPEIVQAGARQFVGALLLLAAVVAVCIGWHYTFSRETAQAVVTVLFGVAAVLVCRVAKMEKGEMSGGPAADAAMEERVPAEDGGAKAQRIVTEGEAQGVAVKQAGGSPGICRYGVLARAALLVCAVVTIVSAGYFGFAPSKNARVYEYLSRAQIEVQTAKDAAAAAMLLDGRGMSVDGKISATGETGAAEGIPFYRYTTVDPENNTSILYGVSNTQYYWSLSDPYVSRFLDETGQRNRMIHQYDSLDERTALNEVVGIRYFLSPVPDGVPFGYVKKEGLLYSNADLWPEHESGDRCSFEVYENSYALPFGFSSGAWISRETYNSLDIPQRQQALLQGIVLEQDPGEGYRELKPGERKSGQTADPAAAPASAAGERTQLSFSDVRIPSQIESDRDRIAVADLTTEDGTPIRFEASEGGAIVTLRFAGLPDCETSLYFRGLKYEPPAGRLGSDRILMTVRGYTGEKQHVSKQIGFTTPRNPWTTGRRDYQINMCYRTEELDRITLTLPAAGTYTFDSMEIVCQPMTEYAAQAQELGRVGMTDLDIHELGGSAATEQITGRITADSPRILCLQIPKTGWSAYVDGVRTELLQADTMFCALPVSAGTHEIELRYQTPGLRLGAVITLGTFLLLILFAVVFNIVSAVLHLAEKRAESVPVGEFEKVGGEPEDRERAGE